MKHRIFWVKTIRFVFLLVGTCVTLLPFIWMILASFKPNGEIVSYPPSFFPETWTISNYKNLFATTPIFTYLKNSAIITGGCTVSILICSCLAAYSISIMKTPGSKVVLSVVTFGIILPVQINYIPLLNMVSTWGLMNTRLGVMLPYLATAFGTYLMCSFFLTIPREIVEAGAIDGLGEVGILTRLVMPLAKPGIATLIIFESMSIWRDFMWPFLVISKRAMFTMPLGVVSFWQGNDVMQWGMIMAIATVAVVPLIIVYFSSQKYFIEGISFSGIKG